jgi:hypothetical protein
MAFESGYELKNGRVYALDEANEQHYDAMSAPAFLELVNRAIAESGTSRSASHDLLQPSQRVLAEQMAEALDISGPRISLTVVNLQETTVRGLDFQEAATGDSEWFGFFELLAFVELCRLPFLGGHRNFLLVPIPSSSISGSASR